jgi:predicted metal-dependent phosphotriesterase family hydrolase
VRDLTEGMDGTAVRAGVIKVGSSLDRVTSAEHRVIRAAAVAQRETGAPITTHTTAGTAAMEQVRALEAAGADLSMVCIGHLDRRLVWDDHLALARSGVFLGYDCIGKEQYQPDGERVRFILRPARKAMRDRCSWRVTWPAAGTYAPGEGSRLPVYPAAVLPRLCSAGLRPEDAEALVVANPARFLAWRAG